jgi:hypothetical protein
LLPFLRLERGKSSGGVVAGVPAWGRLRYPKLSW